MSEDLYRIDVWLAIDKTTDRLVDFGGQAAVQLSANQHKKLSGNETKLRKLKVGMKIIE